jgi:hypothetical protein
MGGTHSPFLSWNSGVEIHAQKMTTDYTSSSTALREKLFPGTTSKPFSVRWSGYFQPSLGAEYAFRITAATPATASVRLVLNAIGASKQILVAATGVTGTISLISNAFYEIEMSYSPTTSELAAAPSLDLQFQYTQTISGVTTTSAWSAADKSRLFPLAGRYRNDYTPTV